MLIAAVLTAAAVGAVPGSAAAATRPAGDPPVELFTCWASPLLLTTAGTPGGAVHRQCVDDQVAGAQGTHTAGNLQVQAVDATGSTSRTGGAAVAATADGGPADGRPAATTRGAVAVSSAASARIVVGATVIEIGAISSEATITCTYDAKGAHVAVAGRSSVGDVRINGRRVQPRTGAMVIRLRRGILRLNHAEVRPTGIVQHAVMFDAAQAHLVIGESAVALAATAGNPCLP